MPVSTTSRTCRCRSPAASSPSSPVSAALANPRWRSTSSSTKASAAISKASMPMRAAWCSLPAGPTWMRCTASRPRWRSSSASPAAGASPQWVPPPKSGTFCACSTSSWACSIACTTARRCSRKRPTASWRKSCSSTAGSTSASSRRWWWGARASIPNWPTGHAHAATRICASMASFCPHKASRALTDSRSITSNCRC